MVPNIAAVRANVLIVFLNIIQPLFLEKSIAEMQEKSEFPEMTHWAI